MAGLAGLLIIGIIIIGSADFSKEKVEIPENGILKISLPLSLEEKGDNESISQLINGLIGSHNMSLSDLRSMLKAAAKDKRIVAISLDAGMFSGGLVKAEEIRRSIDSFQLSGKPVWCYSENYGEQGLYIASTCDKVFANPKGMIEFNGFSSGVVMYKGLLDKLGVDVQVFKVGKFKGAVEPFIQKELSDNNRSQIEAYLGSLFDVQIQQMASDRKLNPDTLKAFALYGNSYEIKNCLALGLVDELNYYDVYEEQLKSKHKNFKWVEAKDYKKEGSDYEYIEDKIAIVYLEGEIISGKSETEGQIASDDVCKMLRKIRENDEIKSVVLRINSPGGSSMASDIIAREIELLKKKKPVIASFSNVAASGGYYISCIADSIFAERSSITGSIGVFAMIPNTGEAFSKTLGLNYESVKSGPQSELWRPDEALNESQQRILQNMVNHIYEDFTQIVARGRKLSQNRVKEIAEGRVYSGVQAKEIGLIDGFGGLDYSLGAAAQKAGLKQYRIMEFPEAKDGFKQLFNALEMNTLVQKSLKSSGVPMEILQGSSQLKNWEGIQMRIPWSTDYR